MARRIPSEFEAFYCEAKDPCFRALVATVGSVAEADDLLAESFTRALARWSEVRRHPRPEAWVVRTALNLHRDRWRRSQRQQQLLHRRETVTHVDVVDPALMAAVQALPERQREVVALRVLLGLSAEQTGEVLGVDPGTVGTHLRRGLAALRAALHPEAPVESSTHETTQEVLQ
jgi:RNA polymerase sigma-70 factor (ECF subfamily)